MDLVITERPEENAILEAVRNGEVDAAKAQLEDNSALIWVKEADTGKTLLHLAIDIAHEGLIRLLLQNGADAETANNDGWRPLATAAWDAPSLLLCAEILLEHGANVDSINEQNGQSALHICALQGYFDMAKKLLDHGAQVDLADVDGKTPLYEAVSQRQVDVARLLLRHGAAKSVRSMENVGLESLASGDADMMRLLKSTPILRGPKTSKRRQGRPRKKRTMVARNPAPAHDQNKLIACHAFKATIVDFYIEETEERIEETVSLHDLLYGKGPKDIMADARKDQAKGDASFRWYHLPANNVRLLESRDIGQC